MTIKEIGLEMATMEIEGAICSKVKGSRNWIIRVEHKEKVAIVGRQNTMKRNCFLTAIVTTIIERKIRWYEYTYKKDFMASINQLEEANYKIYWI